MNSRLYPYFYFYFFSFAFLQFNCGKETVSVSNFRTFPINLSGYYENGRIYLEWTKVRNSTFEEYILVRSESTLSTVISPGEVIARFDKDEEITFIDVDFPIRDSLHFRVFADIGNRNLSSQDLVVPLNFFLFRGSTCQSSIQ